MYSIENIVLEKENLRKKFADNQQKRKIKFHITSRERKHKKTDDSIPSKIALPVVHGYEFVPVNKIVRCKAEGSYTKFFLHKKDPVLVAKPLGDFDKILTRNGFYRVHRSHLINLDHLVKYERGAGVTMSDNALVPVSKRKRIHFMKNLAAAYKKLTIPFTK